MQFTEVVGSVYYMAPKVLKRNYGPEVDFWSAGVILYVHSPLRRELRCPRELGSGGVGRPRANSAGRPTAPPAGGGDLLVASAGLGAFSTDDAISGVAHVLRLLSYRA